MTKNILFYLLAITLFFIAGCKKADTSTPSSSRVYLPYSIKTYLSGAFSDSSTYKYDAANRVTEVITLSGTDKKYTYDGSGNLIELDTYTGATLTAKSVVAYNSTGAIATYSTYSNGVVSTTTTATLSIDANQRVTKADVGSNTFNLFTYDSNGNETSQSSYQGGNTTTPYYLYANTFDNNKGALSDVKGGYFSNDSFLLKNNIVKQSVTSTNTSFTPYSINTTYTYNADGYPTSGTTTNSNSSSYLRKDVYTYITK